MDLGLTEIQQMLKNSAREFLSLECPLTLVRELEEDPRGFTDELWRQIAGLGWTGLAFPEQYGGTGGDFIDLAVLLEEMGRSLVPGSVRAVTIPGALKCSGSLESLECVWEGEEAFEVEESRCTARSPQSSKATPTYCSSSDRRPQPEGSRRAVRPLATWRPAPPCYC